MIDKDKLHTALEETLFRDGLTDPQTAGVDALVDAWGARGGAVMDLRWFAYSCATAYRETGFKMQPVREAGLGRGKAYGRPDPQTHLVYYGRGLPQLTWRANYQKMGDLLGLDLVHNPELMMDPPTSAAALLVGMIEGAFTGKRLADYFTATVSNPVGARAIVNGQDHASLIALYHGEWLTALRAATSLTAAAQA